MRANTPGEPQDEGLERERFETLQQLEDWLETPVMLLGFAWLILWIRPCHRFSGHLL
jgi:hypothetical protein